jgi:hypothetical protein
MLARLVAAGAERRELLVEPGTVGLELRHLRPEVLQLVAVVEAEYPAAAIVDAMAVVLLVAAAAVLDLAGDGERVVRGLLEGAQVRRALVVEAAAQLVEQPVAVGHALRSSFATMESGRRCVVVRGTSRSTR